MKFAEWERGVPDILRKDALWTVKAYRMSLFLADISWHDVSIHRLGLTTEIIKLLLTMVPDQRSQGKQRVCEEPPEYVVKGLFDMDVPF